MSDSKVKTVNFDNPIPDLKKYQNSTPNAQITPNLSPSRSYQLPSLQQGQHPSVPSHPSQAIKRNNSYASIKYPSATPEPINYYVSLPLPIVHPPKLSQVLPQAPPHPQLHTYNPALHHFPFKVSPFSY